MYSHFRQVTLQKRIVERKHWQNQCVHNSLYKRHMVSVVKSWDRHRYSWRRDRNSSVHKVVQRPKRHKWNVKLVRDHSKGLFQQEKKNITKLIILCHILIFYTPFQFLTFVITGFRKKYFRIVMRNQNILTILLRKVLSFKWPCLV